MGNLIIEEDSEEEVDEELQQATLECKRLEEELNKKQTIGIIAI